MSRLGGRLQLVVTLEGSDQRKPKNFEPFLRRHHYKIDEGGGCVKSKTKNRTSDCEGKILVYRASERKEI